MSQRDQVVDNENGQQPPGLDEFAITLVLDAAVAGIKEHGPSRDAGEPPAAIPRRMRSAYWTRVREGGPWRVLNMRADMR